MNVSLPSSVFKRVLCLVPLSSSLPLAGAMENALQISVRPIPVYIERTSTAQLVNCDFVVENKSSRTVILQAIEVSAYDAHDKLILRKFVSDNGNSPSIATLNQREVPPKGRILVFNPLFSFPPDAPLSKLGFAFTLAAEGETSTIMWFDVVPQHYQSRSTLTLPLRGRVLVWDGHDYYSHHRRFNYMTQRSQASGTKSNPDRYGYDFVPMDETGAMWKTGRDMAIRNENWFGFGQPVYAAGAGRVVAVEDGAADNREVDEARFSKNKLADYGNYVLIEHSQSEIALYGHIRQGSARVKLGDVVKQGQQIAAIGASGSSLMPHLHFQLQTTADADGEGLPSSFDSFVRLFGNRSVAVKRGQIDSGDIVQHSASAPAPAPSPATQRR